MNQLPAPPGDTPALPPPDADTTAGPGARYPGAASHAASRGDSRNDSRTDAVFSTSSVSSRRTKPLWIAVAVAIVVATVAAILGWINHGRIDRTEREFARRIQDSGNVAQEARLTARRSDDTTTALQTRLGVLESKLAESQSQQLALEQLYQDLSRTRDDWALAEVEQIVSVASQQLQLAGNVRGAIIGLQNADARLGRTDKPQFITLRRAIQRDIERLNALPDIDVAGNALRIDSLLTMVDSLPMVSDERAAAAPRLDSQPVIQQPVVQSGPAKNAAGAASVKAAKNAAGPTTTSQPTPDTAMPGWGERIRQSLRYAVAEAWQEFQQLIRVRQVERPDALMIAPEQAYFIRENLKLRLLNARLALLARQESTYRDDLLRSQEILQQYFDTRSKQTLAALALVKQIQSSTTMIELPTLSESLSAVRNFKAPRER